MLNDKTLASSIGRGQREADEEFVDRFGPRVHRLVRRYIPTEADAEDVTQEIFVDLFRSAESFRGEAALTTWVYRVALNHCMRHRSRRKPPGESLDAAQEVPDHEPDPAARALQSELSSEVRAAMIGLSAVHREVIVLHELHGLTYGECAGVLGVPIGTVKSRLSNAFRALRASLGSYVRNDSIEAPASAGRPVAGGEAA